MRGELLHHGRGLQRRKEIARRDLPPVGQPPAQQRLDPLDLAAEQVPLGLVGEPQLAVAHGAADAALEGDMPCAVVLGERPGGAQHARQQRAVEEQGGEPQQQRQVPGALLDLGLDGAIGQVQLDHVARASLPGQADRHVDLEQAPARPPRRERLDLAAQGAAQHARLRGRSARRATARRVHKLAPTAPDPRRSQRRRRLDRPVELLARQARQPSASVLLLSHLELGEHPTGLLGARERGVADAAAKQLPESDRQRRDEDGDQHAEARHKLASGGKGPHGHGASLRTFGERGLRTRVFQGHLR